MSARLIDTASVALERQLQAVQREIRIRRQVCPTRVATRRMSQRLAEEELEAMRAAEWTLRELLARSRP